jgi:hypothetical protein
VLSSTRDTTWARLTEESEAAIPQREGQSETATKNSEPATSTQQTDTQDTQDISDALTFADIQPRTRFEQEISLVVVATEESEHNSKCFLDVRDMAGTEGKVQIQSGHSVDIEWEVGERYAFSHLWAGSRYRKETRLPRLVSTVNIRARPIDTDGAAMSSTRTASTKTKTSGGTSNGSSKSKSSTSVDIRGQREEADTDENEAPTTTEDDFIKNLNDELDDMIGDS